MKHSLPNCFRTEQIGVVVAGAGGNGSQVITGLARMHIALTALGHPGLKVRVYDPDIVTEANVGRQLFSPSDVGQYKSDVLVNRINCYFGLDWIARPVKFSPSAEECDILIGCVDSAAARRDLGKSHYSYWLDLGNQEKKGQIILGESPRFGIERDEDDDDAADGSTVVKQVEIKKRLLTVLELFPELNGKVQEDNQPSCSLAEALGRQDLFINQTIATFGLQLLWQFIRQGGLDIQGYFINLESGIVRPLPIDYDRKVVKVKLGRRKQLRFKRMIIPAKRRRATKPKRKAKRK